MCTNFGGETMWKNEEMEVAKDHAQCQALVLVQVVVVVLFLLLLLLLLFIHLLH